MILVKSCSKEFNISESNTIRIGSLLEYRETEKKEILDTEEGFYSMAFDLNNFKMPLNEFNLLNRNEEHHGCIDAYIMSYSQFDEKHVHNLTFKADLTFEDLNTFVFCMSLVDSVDQADHIFKDYDDYWFLDYANLNAFAEDVKMALHIALAAQSKPEAPSFLSRTEQPVHVTTDNLEISVIAQEIIYMDRHLNFDNELYTKNSKLCFEVIKGKKFIKPASFHNEKEFRLVFECKRNGEKIFPIIKSIIVPMNGRSEYIKQKRCNI
ncbi:TPA: hypothetical protein ACXJAD_004894 [Serratia marcescens]|uniref:hypothetical protein n=1 Tax=Serratia marcescens TaxID=615 RepID=UPI0011AB7C88|nr:hypothetical protein [Serratia marcescens]